MKNKYATQENFYSDWLTPPKKTEKAHGACHLVLIDNSKYKHDKLFNISRKKALTKHENVVVKAFFCDETKLEQLKPENQGCFKLTCPRVKERLNDAEFEFDKNEFVISRDGASGVYVYGAMLKKHKD